MKVIYETAGGQVTDFGDRLTAASAGDGEDFVELAGNYPNQWVEGTQPTGWIVTGSEEHRELLDPQGESYAHVQGANAGQETAGSTPTLAQVLAEGADADGAAITGLADPTDDQDAATKAYVDDASPGGSIPASEGHAAGDLLSLVGGQPTFDDLLAARPELLVTEWTAEKNYADALAVGEADDVVQLLRPEGQDSIFAAEFNGITSNQKWYVYANSTPSEGTFRVSFRDETTDPIPFDVTADEFVAIMAALPSIGAGNIKVESGYEDAAGSLVNGDSPYLTTEFIGDLAGQLVESPTFEDDSTDGDLQWGEDGTGGEAPQKTGSDEPVWDDAQDYGDTVPDGDVTWTNITGYVLATSTFFGPRSFVAQGGRHSNGNEIELQFIYPVGEVTETTVEVVDTTIKIHVRGNASRFTPALYSEIVDAVNASEDAAALVTAELNRPDGTFTFNEAADMTGQFLSGGRDPRPTLNDAEPWRLQDQFAYTLADLIWPTVPNGHLYIQMPGYGAPDPVAEPFPLSAIGEATADADAYWWDMGSVESLAAGWRERELTPRQKSALDAAGQQIVEGQRHEPSHANPFATLRDALGIDTRFAGVPGFTFCFYHSSVADVDPQTTYFNFDNANKALATRAYVDDEEYSGGNVSEWLEQIGEIGGLLKMTNRETPAEWVVYKVTGSEHVPTYTKLHIEFVAAGSFDHWSEDDEIIFTLVSPGDAPELPATPDAQDIADALIALGLVTQAE